MDSIYSLRRVDLSTWLLGYTCSGVLLSVPGVRCKVNLQCHPASRELDWAVFLADARDRVSKERQAILCSALGVKEASQV
jgi:hypothetical protein